MLPAYRLRLLLVAVNIIVNATLANKVHSPREKTGTSNLYISQSVVLIIQNILLLMWQCVWYVKAIITYILQRARPMEHSNRQPCSRGGYVHGERSRTYSTPNAGQQRTAAHWNCFLVTSYWFILRTRRYFHERVWPFIATSCLISPFMVISPANISDSESICRLQTVRTC